MTQHSPFSHAVVSRTVDVALASIGLILLSPVILLIMVAIVIETGFPIFFAQTRIARGGRTFRMYKFRKFAASCAGGCPLTMQHDARMTGVGSFLARTKLDEVPQLFNIIRGDMAIVGPRPESLAFAECFTPDLHALLDHRPGIFGPSQVAFRNECALYPAETDPVQFYCKTLFPAKAALDLAYYSRRTFWMDILWIWRGVLAVLGWVPDQNLIGKHVGSKRKIDALFAGH